MSDHCEHDAASAHHHETPSRAKNLLGPTADELAQCPVMKGSTVVKAEAEEAGLYRDYEGQRYWFCCAGCLPKFDTDPAKYAAA